VTESRAPASDPLATLRESLRHFAKERDWDQYHSPKNLATALCIEAAELLEHFQWINEESSRSLSAEQLQKIREEVADVLLYLIRLTDKLDINLLDAAAEKIVLNAKKYPVEKARGTSRKYTEL
jgi:dCTP diphosphatase